MKAFAWTVGAVLLGLGAAANAGSLTWGFSFTVAGDGDSGSGVITTDPEVGGTYAITGVTGMVDGSMITGLGTYATADNVLLAAFPPFDFAGFSFNLASGPSINLFGDGAATVYECNSAVNTSCGSFSDGFVTTTFSISSMGTPVPVPLPESLSLLGLGLAGFAVFGRSARGLRNVGLAA